MYSKMVSLRFPEKIVNEPVVVNLVKKFDLTFNILKATIYPRKEGFVPLFIMWRGIPTPPELPKFFTVAMEPSTAIGGVIRNEQGEPIEGVAVGVHYQTGDPDAAEKVRVEVMIHNAHSTDIKTDSEGRCPTWS